MNKSVEDKEACKITKLTVREMFASLSFPEDSQKGELSYPIVYIYDLFA